MSRIGNAPVTLPSGVDVTIDGATVTVKGSRGALSRTFSERVSFARGEGVINVARSDDARDSKALHGLSRALLRNMVIGVSEGFRRELNMVGVGYRAAPAGKRIRKRNHRRRRSGRYALFRRPGARCPDPRSHPVERA